MHSRFIFFGFVPVCEVLIFADFLGGRDCRDLLLSTNSESQLPSKFHPFLHSPEVVVSAVVVLIAEIEKKRSSFQNWFRAKLSL